MDETRKMGMLSKFLRVYGMFSIVLFSTLLLGFIVETPLLKQGSGALHWTIWDDVTGHVAPMLFGIYIVWSIFLIRAARNPAEHRSFLDFTMWANLAHVATMIPMAIESPHDHGKFFTDIPFLLLLSGMIFFLRPRAAHRGEPAVRARGATPSTHPHRVSENPAPS